MKAKPIGMVLALAAAMVVSTMPVSAVGITGPHVTAFTASPDYINLGMTTDVTLTIGSSAGAGADNYRVSVWSPSDAVVGVEWYNFTSPGTMTMVFGNESAGFMTVVDEVGLYVLKAEWWNDTSGMFEPAAEAVLQTTNVLYVRTELAAGSDPYTDLHACLLAEEFQRGDGIIARGYVIYASTGEYLNATNTPTAIGNVTGTLFQTDRDAVTKTLNYQAQNYFWRTGWQTDWDQDIGYFVYTVDAADGLGNHGSASSPVEGQHGALKMIPSTLPTSVWLEDADGNMNTAFFPGDTVTVVVYSYYDLHFNHNYAYTNTDAANANQSYRLGPDRGGAVEAVLGIGNYDTVAGTFDHQLADLTLTFDAPTETWRGTWTVPTTGAIAGNITVMAMAHDGASTPNGGEATAEFSTLPMPEPVVEYHNQTIYENKTVEVTPEGQMDAMLGYGLAGVGIVIGAAVGFMVARSRKNGGGGSGGSSSSKPSEGKPEEEKKKEDEGWD